MRIGTVADLKDTLTEIHDLLRDAHDGHAGVRHIGFDGGGDVYVITGPATRPAWMLRREPLRVLAVGRIHPPSIIPDTVVGVGCDSGGGISFRIGTGLYALTARVLPRGERT